MSAEPLISIVIPAYNAEAHLGRALASVRAQEAAEPLEVIVVDDGSSDRTADVARASGAPVRLVQQANGGAAAARNRGIAEASGEWIALLDADDEWLPGHLARARARLREHPDLVWFTAPYRREYNSGRVLENRPDERTLVEGGVFPDYFAICGNWINIVDTMLVRRSVFDAIGVFDTGLETGEDLDLWFRIGLEHPRIGYAREPGAVYRHVKGSLTQRGHSSTERALEIVRRGHFRAAECGGDALERVQPILTQWLIEIVRHAALAGEREVLREVARCSYAPVPVAWRVIGWSARLTPAPLWSGLMRLWARLRASHRGES